MLPLETQDIEPAFAALGMTPEQYPAYVESLPFGKKYLLERSSLTMEPIQTQTAQPSKAAPPEATPKEVKPQLDEQQQAFLEFLIANPDTPSTAVYKGLHVGVWKGNQISDSLKAQGLIAEIETRLGRAGRRTIFFIPTFKALELLGKEPPPGRGGVVHRHIQHLVQERATAKGYTAQCEKDLGNGGIVDVHLENGQLRIAVEIAVASKPSRELAHIRYCLAAGYDRVFDVLRIKECLSGRKPL
jgi:hypothetical protein